MKTKKKIKNSVAKRFKVTKTGKVLHGHQNSRHLQRRKSAKTKRRHKEPAIMEGLFARKIKKLLGAL